MTFDLRTYSEGWREHAEEWATEGCKPNQRRAIPSPAGYLMALVGRDGWDAFAKKLGLTGLQLAAQLDAGAVRDDHWPAILKAEKLALRHIEEATPMREKMHRHGIGLVEDDPAV